MRSSALLATVSLLHGPAAAGWKTTSADDVRRQLKEGKSLVTFFMPEMESSKFLLPEWEHVSKEISSDINTLAVNCEESEALCHELDVHSFPAIRLYREDGSVTRFRGRRRSASMLNFVDRVERPVITSLNKENVTDFSTTDDIVFILYMHGNEKTGLLGRFATLASKYTDQFSFGATEIQKGDNRVECYNNIAGTTHIESHITYSLALDDLVTVCRNAGIPPLTAQNQPRVELARKGMVYYVTADEAERVKFNKLAKLAQEKNQNYQFVTVDPQDYPDLPGLVGFGPGQEGLSLWNQKDGQIYKYSGELAPGKIEAFVTAAIAGKGTQWDGTFEETAEPADDKKGEEAPSEAEDADEEAPSAGDEKSDEKDEESHDEL